VDSKRISTTGTRCNQEIHPYPDFCIDLSEDQEIKLLHVGQDNTLDEFGKVQISICFTPIYKLFRGNSEQ